jgi:hypothetical protein
MFSYCKNTSKSLNFKPLFPNFKVITEIYGQSQMNANEELFRFGKIRQLCYHHPAASLATLLHDPLTTTRMTRPLPGLDEEEEKDWQPS